MKSKFAKPAGKPAGPDTDEAKARFSAEMAYGDSVFQYALGNAQDSIEAAYRALEFLPTYAPGLLTVGADEYLQGEHEKGMSRFLTLVNLPGTEPDLARIIDNAGDMLIGAKAYKDGLTLYRAAAARFSDLAVLHQGTGCCAGHLGLHDEAIAASRRALEIEPDNQKFVSDLGFTLIEAGQLEEAEKELLRAVAMDPKDGRAAANLEYCREKIKAAAKLPPPKRGSKE
ncbi:MAG: tetratricopeptide repeat protein [Candidatus Sericytochromatia bacterium]|nr:tetratricopeptide repeat protein [Candidatus Tanganyikabacteria bacterium]